MMDLTVSICTFRRRDLLQVTLDSLCACVKPELAWELLVVDNAGEKAVEDLVRSYADRLPVRYEVEREMGTSFARNHAVKSAQAPVILFTDDDVTFDGRWLACMAAAIREHGDCVFWGGRVEPAWPAGVARPRWFDEARCPMLGDTIVQYRRGEQPRYWDPAGDPPFYTANLALRVEKVAQVGYFNTQVGHRGNVRMGMEDTLMVKALSGAGGKGWYVGDAVVHHPVPPERLTRAYARGFAWRQGWLSVRMLRQEQQGRTPRWLYRAAGSRTLHGLGQCLGGAVRGDAAGAFAGEMEAAFNFSKLWHTLRS